MTLRRLVRSEFRKLTTTKMPLAFLGVLILFAVINAFIVIAGTDMDGSKTFISTEADQQSLVAFASNGFILAALFGAIAVSREYSHHTVIPTFLAAPRRRRAIGAQLGAVAVGGGVLSLAGTALTVGGVALALPTTDYGFLISADSLARVLLAAAFTGAAGAVLGAGIGSIVRSVGGAVTGTTLALIIIPPLIVQLATETAAWMPNTLANVLAGVGTEVSTPAALAALTLWAIVPAAIGLIAVEHRDVV
jgi:ABC-2 type transport system permease protein